MQGDIESVAGMSPKDLTSLFEVISGSDAYRKDYEELEAKKAAADDQLRFVFSKKKTVVAERKQKLEQKTEAEKHIKMQQELVCVARTQTWLQVQGCFVAFVPLAQNLSCYGFDELKSITHAWYPVWPRHSSKCSAL